MNYWTYYLAWIFFSYALREPWLLMGVLAFLLLRGVIPDPDALLRAMRRMRVLRTQVEVNAANVTARRDLALLYLDLLRPKTAAALLEEALARRPADAELLYLSALALHRARRHEDAIPRLLKALEVDKRVRFGEPYLVAGDALFALRRWADALDAYEHYLESNSSSVTAYLRIARVQVRLGDPAAARKAVMDGLQTWRVLSMGAKERSLRNWFAAQWARIWLLREPGAIAAAFGLVALLGAALTAVYPLVGRLARMDDATYAMNEDDLALHDAFSRCGGQSTGSFVGRYTVSPDSFDQAEQGHTSFEILGDRIRSGQEFVQEFCLTEVLERSDGMLRAKAVWHEDVHDPGDASMVEIRLVRDKSEVRFTIAEPGGIDRGWEIKLVRDG